MRPNQTRPQLAKTGGLGNLQVRSGLVSTSRPRSDPDWHKVSSDYRRPGGEPAQSGLKTEARSDWNSSARWSQGISGRRVPLPPALFSPATVPAATRRRRTGSLRQVWPGLAGLSAQPPGDRLLIAARTAGRPATVRRPSGTAGDHRNSGDRRHKAERRHKGELRGSRELPATTGNYMRLLTGTSR